MCTHTKHAGVGSAGRADRPTGCAGRMSRSGLFSTRGPDQLLCDWAQSFVTVPVKPGTYHASVDSARFCVGGEITLDDRILCVCLQSNPSLPHVHARRGVHVHRRRSGMCGWVGHGRTVTLLAAPSCGRLFPPPFPPPARVNMHACLWIAAVATHTHTRHPHPVCECRALRAFERDRGVVRTLRDALWRSVCVCCSVVRVLCATRSQAIVVHLAFDAQNPPSCHARPPSLVCDARALLTE